MPIKSPFKFLDAYTEKDMDAFFGREEEVETLYSLVNKNRLVLVYGPSGSGKTSIIHCGLARRFDPTDWLSISVRRKKNLNIDLKEAISARLKKFTSPPRNLGTIDLLDHLHLYSLRPTYLIFDQFEELIISGLKTERDEFFETINQIYLANHLSCFMIFIIREEYLGHLFDFEEKIPSLMDRRMRIEQMASSKVKEVILRSCKRFNITLEKPEENSNHIIKVVSANKKIFQLPYLQVYLDMLYREDFDRTYPEQAHLEELPIPIQPLEFTSEEIEQFGEFDNVLRRYLLEQRSEIERALIKKFSENEVKFLSQLLEGLVTESGTKRIIRFNQISTQNSEATRYKLGSDSPDSLRKIPPRILDFLLTEFQKRRLIRLLDDNILELSHDSLAKMIDEDRDEEQILRNEAFLTIKSAFRVYQKTEETMSRKQINIVEDYLEDLKNFGLTEVMYTFVQKSKDQADIQEKAEGKRLRNELANQRKINRGVVIGLVLMSGLSFLVFNQSRKADASRKSSERYFLEARQETFSNMKKEFKQLLSRGQLFLDRREFNNAITSYRDAVEKSNVYTQAQQQFLNNVDSAINTSEKLERIHLLAPQPDTLLPSIQYINTLITQAQKLDSLQRRYNNLLEEAEQEYERQDYFQAFTLFEQAKQIPIDDKENEEAKTGMEKARLKLEPQYEEYKRLIDLYLNRGGVLGKRYARDFLQEARKILPFLGGIDKGLEKEKLDNFEQQITSS